MSLRSNLYILYVILFVCCCNLFSQEINKTPNGDRESKNGGRETTNDDRETTNYTNKDVIIFNASTTIGKDWFNNRFFVNTFGVDYATRLNNKTTLHFGTNIFNINTSEKLIDRTPKRNVSANMYVQMTYQVNEKLILGGDLFYNGIYNAIGGSIDMIYKLSENSFFEFSASFIKQLQPSGYHYPVPYGYYDVFNPWIFGY